MHTNQSMIDVTTFLTQMGYETIVQHSVTSERDAKNQEQGLLVKHSRENKSEHYHEQFHLVNQEGFFSFQSITVVKKIKKRGTCR